MFSVEFSDRALKALKKLDKSKAAVITAWIKKNLEGCADPRRFGKPLVGNKSGEWRYRVGDYRILAEIQDSRLVIYLVNIGHRRSIYKD